jgi:GntR family transcriptional regulator
MYIQVLDAKRSGNIRHQCVMRYEQMKRRPTLKKDWSPGDLALASGSAVPKYLQLRDALRAAIANGRWSAGERIPAEDALTAVTGLSLGTVQRAVRTLADDGVVVRRHGLGTFIVGHEKPMNAPFYHCRFLDDDGRQLPIFSKALARRPAARAGEWSRHLSGADVVCIERLFSINDEFTIYTHLYLDAARFPTLAATPVAKLHGINFKDLIAREYHLPLKRFSEKLTVTVFPAHVCKAIGVKRATSGAVLEVVAHDPSGGPVYFQDLHIPPNRRRLFIA